MGLFTPAWKDKSWNKRFRAIESGKLDDDTLLYMAKNDVDLGVRYKAAHGIRSQEKIVEAIISNNKPKNVLQYDNYSRFVQSAIKNISDPTLLERIFLANCDASSAAFSQINDIEILKKIAVNDSNYKKSAEHKIVKIQNDPRMWLDYGKEYGFDDEVLSHINDENVRMDILKKIARKDKSIHRRNDAINQINNDEQLLELIFSIKDNYNLTTAIEKLQLHESVMKIIDATNVSSWVTLTAAKKLLSMGLLLDHAQYDKVISRLIECHNAEMSNPSLNNADLSPVIFNLIAEQAPQDLLSSYGITQRTYSYSETGLNGEILNYIGYEILYKGDVVAVKEKRNK